MKIPKKKRINYGMVQFRTHTPELRAQLSADVAKSPYKDATEYLQALTEMVLTLERRLGGKSGIEEFFLSRRLVETIPLEIIEEIGSVQNRNCDQMVAQLIQEALPNYYRFQDGTRYILSPSDLVEERLLSQRLSSESDQDFA